MTALRISVVVKLARKYSLRLYTLILGGLILEEIDCYRTRVRSLGMLVTDWLTHWLPNSVLFSKLYWCNPGVWRCQLETCWGLLLLLMLMMRIVSATVCCRFGSWGLVIKQSFCLDFEHKVWSRFWSWSSGLFVWWKDYLSWKKNWLGCWHWLPLSLADSLTPSLISLQFVCDEMLMFGWNFEVSVVEIMKMKLDQDLFRTCFFGNQNSTLGSVVPLAMFLWFLCSYHQ